MALAAQGAKIGCERAGSEDAHARPAMSTFLRPLLIAAALSLPLVLARSGRADTSTTPPCSVEIWNVGKVPANAPGIPLHWKPAAAQIPRITLTTGAGQPLTLISDDSLGPGDLVAVFGAPPAVGQGELTFTCTPAGAPNDVANVGRLAIFVGDAQPLPSGALGTTSTSGQSAAITLSDASSAFAQLSVFTVRHAGKVLAASTAPAPSWPYTRVDVGYVDVLDPLERPPVPPYSMDLRLPLYVAPNTSICPRGASGTTTATLTVEQRLFGTSAPAASSDVEITVDCTLAQERAKHAPARDDAPPAGGDDGGGCAFASRRGSGEGDLTAAAGVLVAFAACVVRRRQDHARRRSPDPR